MEECEALCDRLGIMVNGQFQCFGSGNPHFFNFKLTSLAGLILGLKLKLRLQWSIHNFSDPLNSRWALNLRDIQRIKCVFFLYIFFNWITMREVCSRVILRSNPLMMFAGFQCLTWRTSSPRDSPSSPGSPSQVSRISENYQCWRPTETKRNTGQIVVLLPIFVQFRTNSVVKVN